VAGELQDKVALVTGAGQGSGEGIARELAQRGAAVALIGRTLSKLERVRREIESVGGRAIAVACDVGDSDQISSSVELVVAELGTVDILVNVAHHDVRAGQLLETTEEDMDANWRTGPLATLRFMRACHPHLKGGGVVVNTGSGAMYHPEGYGVYAAAKEGIAAITRAAAHEWGPDGIRAHLIVPLTISPAFEADMSDPDRRAAVLATIPLGRFSQPEDVGRIVAFLAGPEAVFITGQTLIIDGGRTSPR